MYLSLLAFICVSQGIAQQQKINKELNFTLNFVFENDTLVLNKEYSIIVNGPFPTDNSGHEGGLKENFRKTDSNGNFNLYIVNPGEYEFIVLGKGSVKKRIGNIVDHNLFVRIENK